MLINARSIEYLRSPTTDSHAIDATVLAATRIDRINIKWYGTISHKVHPLTHEILCWCEEQPSWVIADVTVRKNRFEFVSTSYGSELMFEDHNTALMCKLAFGDIDFVVKTKFYIREIPPPATLELSTPWVPKLTRP